MATADEVIVEFKARMDRYEADLRRAQKAFEKSTKSQKGDMASLERQIDRSSKEIGGKLRSLAGVFAAAFSARQIQQLADGYTRFTNVLAVSGLEGEQLANVQERLFGTAQKYGVELESLGTLYGRAAQSSKELGASQDDLLQFTQGVSAALKIQGASATQASGALLQLSQALASGIVRAEEYNSINEGALPILKAVAANIEAAGGSVGRLRVLVTDGKVTSQEFFRAFLAGSQQLEEQAARTSLTIGNSFTVLNNALGKFVGETDDALSATERISAAIIGLSNNLETLAPIIATLSLVLLGRYAASMAIAARANLAKSATLRTLYIQAGLATTNIQVLAAVSRAAGTTMLAAFGGPVGLAVTALLGAILYLATVSESAAEAAERLRGEVEEAEGKTQTYARRLRDAGVAVDGIGNKSNIAAGQVRNLGDQLKFTGDQALEMFRKLQLAEVFKIGTRLGEIQSEREALAETERRRPSNQSTGSPVGLIGRATRGIVETLDPKGARETKEAQAEQKRLLDREETTLKQRLELIKLAAKEGVDITQDKVDPAAPTPEKPGKTPKAPKAPKAKTGPTAEEIEDRFISELTRIRAEQLVAEADLTTSIEDRADIFQELLQLEKNERIRQIENDKDFTKEQKKAQIEALERLYGKSGTSIDEDGNVVVSRDRQRGLLEQQVERDLRDQQVRQAVEMLALEADAMAAMAAITVSLEDRFALERSLLDTQQEIERQLLEQAIINGQIADAERARLLLAQRQAAEREGQRRDQMSPIEQYRFDLQSTANNLNNAVEQLGVDTLKNFNRELVDAIVNWKSLGDVGLSALRSLTAGLLDLVLQQITLKLIGATLGNAAVATTSAQAGAAAAAWAPAAALASLATLGANAGPAAAAIAGTNALTAALALTGAGRKDGGPIMGRGGPREDKVLIAASPEEYMINARAARSLGRSALDYINATGRLPSTLPQRRDGGPITGSPILPSGMVSTRSAGGGGIDASFMRDLRQAITEATRTMPPIELYPTIRPEDVLTAALRTPSGRKAMFDFTQANSNKVKAQLD